MIYRIYYAADCFSRARFIPNIFKLKKQSMFEKKTKPNSKLYPDLWLYIMGFLKKLVFYFKVTVPQRNSACITLNVDLCRSITGLFRLCNFWCNRFLHCLKSFICNLYI